MDIGDAARRRASVTSLHDVDPVRYALHLIVKFLEQHAGLRHFAIVEHVAIVSPYSELRARTWRFVHRLMKQRLTLRPDGPILVHMADLSEQAAMAELVTRLTMRYTDVPPDRVVR